MRNRQLESAKCVTIAEAGSDRIKLIQVTRDSTGVCVTRLFVKKFDTVDDEFMRSLSAEVRKLRLGNAPVVACLPRQVVNVRLLEVPSTDPDEIAGMVELQVGKQTPYSRDEIVADYRTIGAGRDGHTRIMLIMVQQGIMRQRFRILEEAGLDVESMSVSSEGMLNWYRSIHPEKAGKGGTVLLDVDAGCSDLSIIVKGQLVFTKSILVGASQLLDEPDKWREKLAREVENSIEMYRGEAGGYASLDTILLSGASQGIEGLDVDLGNRLKLEAKSVDCMQNVRLAEGLPGMRDKSFRGLSFTPVIGMAMDPGSLEFALVPESVKMRRDLETKARRLTAMGIGVLAVGMLLSVLTIVLMHQKLGVVIDLRSRLKETEAKVAEVNRMSQTVETIMERLDSSRAPVNILLELCKVTPPLVMYDSIVFETEGVLVLKGRAHSFPDVDMLRVKLETSSAMFPNVVSRLQRIDPRTGQVEFELACLATKE
ncbi:MAG: pilus assembly protein PilM [bacterium]